MQPDAATHPVVIKRTDFPKGRRILVAGDVHGEGDLLLRTLQKARFSKDDILVLVGDYLRRGRENLKTLRTVMELCRTHTVFPLCGNNDLYILDCVENPGNKWEENFIREFTRKGSSVFRDMAQEIGINTGSCPEPGKLRRSLQKAFQRELDFIRELPTILETKRFTFVHGGLPVPELDALEGMDAYTCMKLNHYMNLGIKLPKYTVVGHWPASLYRTGYPCNNPLVNDSLRLISIDGGCSVKQDGQINVLILPEQFEDGHFPLDFVFCDNFPQYQVLEGQEASLDSFYICWADPYVKLLERQGGSCLIRHLSSGHIFPVPEDKLWEEKGRLVCGDYTDYRVAAQPGDVVSLVFSTEEGAFVKKGGCCGWYKPGLSKLKAL